MLDVHPPHGPTHTRKDFFIHIATIVIGLLIAIALEQTVEIFHHHHQVADAREALQSEREENLRRFKLNVRYFREETAALENNLEVLTVLAQHPRVQAADLPGILTWGHQNAGWTDAAWNSIQTAGITAYMPRTDVEQSAGLYAQLKEASAYSEEVWRADLNASSYQIVDPDPSHLTAAQIDALITLTVKCLLLQYNHGVDLENISEAYPDFKPLISFDELDLIIHAQTMRDPKYAPAVGRTLKRIQAQYAAMKGAAERHAAEQAATKRK